MTQYLGEVSCDLHKCSSRVRVNIQGSAGGFKGIPLSVKAYLGDYPRHLFKKGRTVEVEQSRADGTMFRVTRVYEAVHVAGKKSVTITVHAPDADAFRRSQEVIKDKMSKSKGHVRFFLPARYFTIGFKSNGMTRETCVKILNAVFGSPVGLNSSWGCQMTAYPEGFWIVCRPSQFSHFIIARYDANECINGIKDLKPAVISPQRARLHDKIADDFGDRVNPIDVRAILKAAGVSNEAVVTSDVFDVSRNFGPH